VSEIEAEWSMMRNAYEECCYDLYKRWVMDLVALTLIAFSMLALFGAILAGFIFAPWVMALGALGLLALLPRITDAGSADSNSLTLNPDRAGQGSAPSKDRPAAPIMPPQPGSNGSNQTADLLQYRGHFYRATASSKTAALQETRSSDR
jgi:hypothetical protein